MAEKVGQIHVHDLPSQHNLDRGVVYRCHCNKEFYVDISKDEYNDETKGWWEVEGKLVRYDKTVGGKEFIGNWSPDIEFDEETPADEGQTDSDGGSGTGEDVRRADSATDEPG